MMKFKNILSLKGVLKPRHNHLNENSLDRLNNDVTAIFRLFQLADFNAYLVGGLGLAIRDDQFYRNHRDIDIAIFTEDFEKLINYLQDRNYRIMSRHLSTHISPWHNLQVVSNFDYTAAIGQDPAEWRIRVMRKGKSFVRFAGHRTDFLDIFFLGKTEDGVILHGYDAMVPWQDFLPVTQPVKDSALLLPNIRYKCYLPPISTREEIDFQKAGIQPIYT